METKNMYKNIIEAKDLKLTYTIQSSFSLKKIFTKTSVNSQITKIEALRGVSFELEKNKNLGIIGTNGSGKSTLLRVLSKTFAPDTGSLVINAKKSQLLTLGAGFIEDLSGRDNLHLNALLLGISKDDLNNGLAEEIIEFSELGKFIDLPMYTYSSGMKSRLTFSVAACIQPELLLLDEVFSVGDAHFRAKSTERIKQMINSQNSVIMISHDTKAIEEHCENALWLHLGEVKMVGASKDVMKEYLEFTKYVK